MSSSKKRYHQSFRETYSAEFPCMMRSRKGETFAFCSMCSCDINIAYGGRTELANHVKSVKHVSNTKMKDSSRKIDSFFTNAGADDVIRAECLFTSFFVEHNIPLAAADHAGSLFKKMFPGSEIAKKYGCGRTKTTHILKEMATESRNELISCMQHEPFTLATDGSNDSDAKLYPLVVTCFEEKQGKIVTSVLSVPALVGDSTGHNIGNLLISQLKYHKIPIENCLAFCSDNAPVMIGKKNGVAAVLREAQPNVFVLGCSCHLINLAAEKGASSLPVKVDEVLVNIFYYLEKSCKRKERLKKFQELHDKETKKILKHVCTRWLSLGKCLQRLLEQWDPLVSFFKDEVLVSVHCASSSLTSFTIPKAELGGAQDHGKRKTVESSDLVAPKRIASATRTDTPVLKSKNISVQTREEKLFMFLSSGLNRAFCAFLCAVIPIFENLNSALQSASPHIHKLLDLMTNLLQQLLCRFVKPKVIKSSSLLQKVQYHLIENQRDNDDLVIGVQTMTLVKKLSDKDQSVFFSSVRAYFCSACDYIINKFPLNDDVLKHAKVADVSKIEDSKFSSVEYFVQRFPSLLPRKGNESTEDAMNVLQNQFVALQIEDSATFESENLTDDSKWAHLMSIRGADGLPKYDRLSRLMLSILTLPHSNAECERVFSLVKKNRNQFRSSMSYETLESISVLKTRSSGPCYTNSFSSEFLKKAKKATHLSLSSASCNGT